ncbi:AMP-binding protein [Chitinivorax sp. PXF-14]|uniref:phenylacetate--CoA ligase family protein n=1 Tax=Chitinivorax sp. PXF-14 TaxID=3230488 RepID=UPI00346701EA
MGIYTALCANLLFPMHERLKHHDTVAVRRELERTQWLSREQVRALQLSHLHGFLGDAARQVPYYRELFRSLDFDPASVTSVADLARLPLLTKDVIRREFERLKADSDEPVKLFSTTGSTGDPLRFNIGNTRVSHDVAAKWRATRWWDVDIGDRELVIWSSAIELSAQDRVRRARDWLMRSRLMPSASLKPADMDRYLDEIRAFRPTMLFGYPSSMTLIAQHAEKRRVRMDDLGIKVAFCTAERLYPHQADTLKRVFGCPVANGYGGRDSGFIAHECRQGGLHITAEDLIVEIVDERGQPVPAGEPGEVVVTHLYSGGFPFIRYKNGDVAVLDDAQCACGRGLPLLKEVRGRTNDVLIAQDGTMVHDVAFAMVLRDMPGVNAFKIIQESLSHCRLQLVTDERFQGAASEARIRGAFAARLGANVQTDIEYLAAIEPERTGKYRYVVSKVSQIQAGVPAATN